MSLATRCIACGTIFRVVQEQLKVSEGWVRCGRCDEIFNAIEGLFDLERDAPPNWVSPHSTLSPPAAVVSANFITPSTAPENEHEVIELGDEDRINSRFFQPEQEDVDKAPSHNIAQRDRVDFADARFNDDLLSQIDPHITAPTSLSGPPKKNRKRSRSERKKNDTPQFLASAQRQALWQSTPIRVVLTSLSAFLLLALGLQIAFHFRDTIAAKWPTTRAGLSYMCQTLHCQLSLPRAIADITIESSTLSPSSSDTYRLTVVLRNRHTMMLATPWLDVAISDTQGQLIARRVLSTGDLRANPGLAPSVDTPLQVFLSAKNQPIKAYTVEIFYP
jgi:predicted Zn finger-like uncharacterized protein